MLLDRMSYNKMWFDEISFDDGEYFSNFADKNGFMVIT